jgi:hypothetical protein
VSDELGELRQRIEARRKRLLRKHRLLKLAEVAAWAFGLIWTALLLGSLVRPLDSGSPPHRSTPGPGADELAPWRLAHVRSGASRQSGMAAGLIPLAQHWIPQAEAGAVAKPRILNEAGVSRQVGEAMGSPISHDAYNVISALHAKHEGLEAYRKYSWDGDQRIWKELTERDDETVRLLCAELEKLAREGRLCTSHSGKSTH